jgi:hypothetical protein
MGSLRANPALWLTRIGYARIKFPGRRPCPVVKAGYGRINVVLPDQDGDFQHHIAGQVRDNSTGNTLVIPGLWALLPGIATNGGVDSIWFSAGPTAARTAYWAC